MTAQRIGVFTIDFPDPYTIDYDNNKFTTLNESLSFQDPILGNIQTLSTKGANSGTDPYGILYVPNLQTEECRNAEPDHVPANATRLHNLPPGENYALIAVAPWYNAQCMLEYFAAARQSPTKAVLVYQPGQSNAKPPMLNDPSWDLDDGGSWQAANTFPTYALSSMTGGIIMDQLSQYSGNLTDVPYGEQLAHLYDTSDYVRLWATVSIESTNRLPSLWVFLLIVTAILLIAVSVTSIAMHIFQRRRRRALHQRVINGEVDLEALGVKRLTVSQQVLDKLPVYTYTANVPDNLEKSAPQVPVQALILPSSSVDPEMGLKTSGPTVPTTGISTSWSQSTCPICLDDFESNETQVRELPCRHVFHPDCIDTFLLRNSSLCPMCKQSVLPKGDCPVHINNTMVRRERHIARLRARSALAANRQPRTVQSSAPERTQSRPSDIEMADATTAPQSQNDSPAESQPANTPPAPSTQAATRDCEPSQNRREWARQRALALLGNRHVLPSDAEAEVNAPRWRRGLRRVFPGFR